jgi:methylene-tetrahydromethanopterin dehydrogenase
VAADVNAVPPPGIAGLEAHHHGEPIKGSKSGAVGVGALAIGRIKYQAQHRLLTRMTKGEPVYLDYNDAFAVAREAVAE